MITHSYYFPYADGYRWTTLWGKPQGDWAEVVTQNKWEMFQDSEQTFVSRDSILSPVSFPHAVPH